ncbi:unnamed protein product [Hyaloperonospora brassicae]|nr:unnamed protein product [Hyaloperonospora brassicae]
MLAVFEAFQARVTGKDKSWANTGAGQKTSWTEIPNVLFTGAGTTLLPPLWQVYYAGNLEGAQGIVAGTNDPAATQTGSCREGIDDVWPTKEKEAQDAMHAE